MNKYQAFIFDMDGVFRCADEPISGTKELTDFYAKKDIPSIILTNECRFTHDQILDDFKSMGIDIPPKWSIYSAADAARDFLKKIYTSGYVYILGEYGLKLTLKNDPTIGPNILDGLPDITLSTDLYVVLGTVNKLSDDDLEETIRWIRCGAKVIMTCPDVSDPGAKGENSMYMPGHILYIIRKMIPCNHYCVGKPNPMVLRSAYDILKKSVGDLEMDHILFVGDSLDTDIKIAFEHGMDSALVLTGNTRMYMVKDSIIQPNYIFHSVKEIYKGFL